MFVVYQNKVTFCPSVSDPIHCTKHPSPRLRQNTIDLETRQAEDTVGQENKV